MKTAIKISTLCLLILGLSLGSCKKDKNTEPVSIVGTWTGYWTHEDVNIKHDFTVTFNADNTGRVIYDTYDVPCNWQLDGNKVTFDYYQSSTERFRHAAPVSGNKMKGTWGDYPEEDGRGIFELIKR